MTAPGQHSAPRVSALSAIPRELTTIMRPELPSLLKEMLEEIVGAIPEYADLLDGQGARVIRRGIEQNVVAFVEQVGLPPQRTTGTMPSRDEICRQFGRFEAYEGRNLDRLLEAYRIACQVALRRVRVVGRRYNLSAALLMTFADALFAYMGEIAELSREGYRQALVELGEEPDNRRRRLLRRILAGAPMSRATLKELAQQANWTLPEEVTMVALHPGSRPKRSELDGEILADLADPEPHLLVPGHLDDMRRISLSLVLTGCRAAVGLTTTLSEAPDSLRWARQALALSETGVLTDLPVVFCEDHLLQLWLLGDPPLLRQFGKRYLRPLESLTPTQRSRLSDTLRSWLSTRDTAPQMAEELGVHPQTIRYRLRVLERIFGPRLSDPDERFGIEVALRALRLQSRNRI
ncbi:hypothetical protein ABH940_001325 [Streptacidiphilus sp. BW17]|uniref:PucR family transcriptional regulator n=1 Tax=Streptacidiphilus sp. BW17 TaxID=3156274 RepID=UPI003517BDE8